MNNLKKWYDEGSVTLPLAEYNKMLQEVLDARALFTLKKNWDKSAVEVVMSPDAANKIAQEKFKARGLDKQYDLREDDQIYWSSITIADLKKPDGAEAQ